MVSYNHDHDNEVVPFGETNFRNQRRRFGIKTDDRRRHMYLLGKTGMGKTTLLENMVLADINAGHGVGVVDPHGDFAEKLLDFIPSNRINDVVYFNPADTEYPIGFNVLEAVNETHKHLVASGLMGVFKKIWPDVWSPRMEYILNNCILALLEYPGSTLLGINRLLVDKDFRKMVVSQLRDPVVKTFWVNEYALWEPKFRNEAIAPIQNKVGQFLSASIIRNIVAQVKSTINPREIMDSGKIFIMNLAKGRVGEDTSRLMGGMLITKIQLAAMERVDMPEPERRDFYLYVDEFQNFATQSFANILSEARKYRLNLIIAHQYIEQLDEEYVRPAVFGNVGTIVCFRVGAKDGEFLENEFAPTFTPTDLVNLTKFEIYLKLMIDGVSSSPFSAKTLSPIAKRTGNNEKVINVSRERYSEPRAVIEEKIMKWTGLYADEIKPKDQPIAAEPARYRDVEQPMSRKPQNFSEQFNKPRPPAPPMPANKPRLISGLKDELSKGLAEIAEAQENKAEKAENFHKLGVLPPKTTIFSEPEKRQSPLPKRREDSFKKPVPKQENKPRSDKPKQVLPGDKIRF